MQVARKKKQNFKKPVVNNIISQPNYNTVMLISLYDQRRKKKMLVNSTYICKRKKNNYKSRSNSKYIYIYIKAGHDF